MSVDFFPTRKILMQELFDGRLSVHGVTELPGKSPHARCLADEGGALWVYGDDDDRVGCITVYALNRPVTTLVAIVEAFQVELISEYELHDCWYKGLESREELELGAHL
jgi:hypothetical protein